ncbi:MAG TPA: GNAT family N-acetyltransferase [Chloroflexia bacterium]
MSGTNLVIRPFTAADQAAARRLILDGLAEHFGWLDETLNPDLDDIAAHYVARGALFVVAEIAGVPVGTGALVAEGPGGRLARISVAPAHRRRGVGRALVAHLVGAAQARGWPQVLVETNDDWYDAIALYQRYGFREYTRAAGEVHMVLDLATPPAPGL